MLRPDKPSHGRFRMSQSPCCGRSGLYPEVGAVYTCSLLAVRHLWLAKLAAAEVQQPRDLRLADHLFGNQDVSDPFVGHHLRPANLGAGHPEGAGSSGLWAIAGTLRPLVCAAASQPQLRGTYPPCARSHPGPLAEL